MNKNTTALDDKDDEMKLFAEASRQLDVGISFEFFKTLDNQWDRLAEVAVKVVILFLMFMIVVFVGFLFYLGLR